MKAAVWKETRRFEIEESPNPEAATG